MSSYLPYDFDALLPIEERYASPKFRRVARTISFRLLDWADAVELVGFVETIGLKHARFIFHWRGQAVVRAYRRLKRRVGADAEAVRRANEAQMGLDQGLAVLRAMQDGGWTHGTVPWCVKMALKELRKRGHTIAEIAQAVDLSREQVKTICDVRVDRSAERAAAVGALAL